MFYVFARNPQTTKPNLKIIKQDTYIDDVFLSSKETEHFWWFCHSVVPRGKQIRPGIMRINNVGAKKIKLEIRQAATSVGKRKWRLKSRLVKWASSYYLLLHLVVQNKLVGLHLLSTLKSVFFVIMWISNWVFLQKKKPWAWNCHQIMKGWNERT